MEKISIHILNISSFFWFISIIVFMGIMAIATKLMTNDPSFTQGGGEAYLLIPMLFTSLAGVISFVFAILSWLVLKLKHKNNDVRNIRFIGIKPKYFFFGGFLMIYSAFIFLFGWRQGSLLQSASGAYSGQELFDEINTFRTENKKTPVTLDVSLCDNLVSRYKVVSQGKGSHEGFEEWAQTEGLTSKYELAEMYIVDAETPREAIESWNSSPGHRLVLLGDYKSGCSYALNGDAVVIFGNQLK